MKNTWGMFSTVGIGLLLVLTIMLAYIATSNREIHVTVDGVTPTWGTGEDHTTSVFETIRTYAFGDVAIEHRCNGEVKYGTVARGSGAFENMPWSYCVGENQLVAVQDGSTVVIDHVVSTGVTDAPTLRDAMRVGTSDSLLIAFGYRSCFLNANDCDVDFVTDAFTYAYNRDSHEGKALHAIPVRATFVWDGTGTYALTLGEQIGGAGCDLGPVGGYSLLEDKTFVLTEETACPSSTIGTGTDLEGNLLPSWGSAEFTGPRSFQATMLDPDGTWEMIGGTY